jgi:esterase
MKLENFHYSISGNSQAPWLVFIHGLTGSSANWRKIIPAFEADFNILVYDQRAHGKSFAPPSGYAPEDYAGDLKFLMDSLKIKKANPVGHSMGGRTALCFTNLYPERVEKLVIEDIGPNRSEENGSLLAKRLAAIPVPFENRMKAKEYLLNDFGDPKLGMFLYTNIGEDEKGSAVWKIPMNHIIETIEIGRSTDRWFEIKGLKCPTLVIRGENSNELSREEFLTMQSMNSLVRGVEISDSGHWVHFDQPQEFIKAVQEFLASRSPSK